VRVLPFDETGVRALVRSRCRIARQRMRPGHRRPLDRPHRAGGIFAGMASHRLGRRMVGTIRGAISPSHEAIRALVGISRDGYRRLIVVITSKAERPAD